MDFTIRKTELTAYLDSDTQLLLRCLTLHPAPQPGDFVLLNRDSLLTLLEEHRLSMFFYERLDPSESTQRPIKDQLNDRYVAAKFRMLAYVAELCRLLRLLQQHDIQAIALKGPMLGQLYYNDNTLRECNDLDILVRPSDVDAAYQLLLDSGYQLGSVLWNSPKQKEVYKKTYYHYSLYHPEHGTQVELHWRLNLPDKSYKATCSAIWANLTVQPLGGFPVPVLASVDNFIYLCIHGCTHDWKRLFWALDIAQIIEKEGPVFLINAYEQAIHQQVDRYVLAGCHMATVLFGSPLPSSLSEAIRADSTIARLSANFLFFINQTATPYKNPLSSFHTLLLSIRKLFVFYQSTFFLGGTKAVLSVINRFFINPDYWAIYSFSDKFFALNYIAAPFLWIYSTISRSKK